MNRRELLKPSGGLWLPPRPEQTLGGAYLGIFMPIEAVAPELTATEATMAQLVAQLNRDDALVGCAVINCIVSGSGVTPDLDRQKQALETVITDRDLAALGAWERQHQGPSRVIIFFRGQLLEMMRWVARYADPSPGSGESLDLPEHKEAFLRAAMVAGELWSTRVYGGKLSGDEPGADALTNALGAFRKGVEEADTALHMGIAFGRGAFLFETYVPRRLDGFDAHFQAATGLTVDEYLILAGSIMQYASDRPPGGRLFTEHAADNTAYAQQFATFLAGEVQTPDQLASGLWDRFDQVGYKAILDRPILRVSSGQHVVLDPSFFADHFTVSPLFKVIGRVKANEAFGAFGEAFEDYAGDILHRIYGAPPFLKQRLFRSVGSGPGVTPQFEIDAVLNEGEDLIIMELKAVFLREEVFHSDDPEAFLDELRSKYASAKESGERAKGVTQLARSIRAIVRDGWTGAEIDRGLLKRIHPVLLVHDERMGSPGMGAFLDRILSENLGDLSSEIWIAPLTVMTIDDLENQESSISFTLLELLKAYATACPDGVTSLRNYMAHTHFGKDVMPNAELLRRSMELVGHMMDELFPGRSEGEASEPQPPAA